MDVENEIQATESGGNGAETEVPATARDLNTERSGGAREGPLRNAVDGEGVEGGEVRGGEERVAEDEIDPHTGIPKRWSQFWPTVNANQSFGVGLRSAMESAGDSVISDGLNTLLGNFVESTQMDDGVALDEGGEALAPVAGGSSTESHTTAAETARDNSKQTNLRSWLK